MVNAILAARGQSTPEAVADVFFVEADPVVSSVNGRQLISERQFFDMPCAERMFNVAIGDPASRKKIVTHCLANGAKPFAIQSSHAVIYDSNEIGDGAILCAHTTVTSNVRIGRFFHANIYSYVAHDCIIGDYVTFAPNVHCNGNVHIGDYAYIGTGAVIKQGSRVKPLVIGEGAVVGMGAVVTKDVPAHSTVLGNPARLR